MKNIIENEGKKPSKAGAIFKGLWLIFVYVVAVTIPQLFVMIPMFIRATANADSIEKYQESIMNEMTAGSELLTLSTFIGTIIAVAIVIIWYYIGVYKRDVKAGTYVSVLPKLKNVNAILLLVTGTIASYALAVIILDALNALMPTIGSAFNTSMGAVVGGIPIIGLLLTLVIAPIGEEVCLRGIFLNRAEKSFGMVGCIILSGILFGIYHLNPIQGLYAIPIGMFFGYVAYKFKSVIPCIFCHFVNNLMASLGGVHHFGENIILPIICFVIFGFVTVFLAKKTDIV